MSTILGASAASTPCETTTRNDPANAERETASNFFMVTPFVNQGNREIRLDLGTPGGRWYALPGRGATLRNGPRG